MCRRFVSGWLIILSFAALPNLDRIMLPRQHHDPSVVHSSFMALQLTTDAGGSIHVAPVDRGGDGD